MNRRRNHPRRGERGFSLLEPLIGGALLLLAFFGMARMYAGGHAALVLEEDRRRAIGLGQERIDTIRRESNYDDLVLINDEDPYDIVVDGRTFTIDTVVGENDVETNASSINVTVSWTARVAGNDIPRFMRVSTILARGLE